MEGGGEEGERRERGDADQERALELPREPRESRVCPGSGVPPQAAPFLRLALAGVLPVSSCPLAAAGPDPPCRSGSGGQSPRSVSVVPPELSRCLAPCGGPRGQHIQTHQVFVTLFEPL